MTTENNGPSNAYNGLNEGLNNTPKEGPSAESMKGHPMAGPLNNVEQMVESGIQSAISALKKAGVNFDGNNSDSKDGGPNLTLDPGGPKYEDFNYQEPSKQNVSPEEAYTSAAQNLGDLAGSRFTREPEPEPQPQPDPQSQGYGYDYNYSQQPYSQVPAQGAYQGYQPVPLEPKEKPKRVGVFTAVTGLIATGIVITAVAVGGVWSNALDLVSLAPLILVLFGLEILICNVIFRGRKLKYDGMAIFLSILVSIFGVSGVLNTQSLSEVRSVVSDRAELKNSAATACNELETAMTEALRSIDDFAGVDVEAVTSDGNRLSDTEDWVLYSMNPFAEITARPTIYMNGPYDNAEAFANSVFEMLKIAKSVEGIDRQAMEFVYQSQSNYTSIYIDKSHFFASPSWILENMDTSHEWTTGSDGDVTTAVVYEEGEIGEVVVVGDGASAN